ncbi:hypothetical protein [Leucobacter sp. 1207-22]|uniref:hypothetical protein n=1 Tax=Leucobacter sp. 1207-22 TaxID=2604456 RepID=UPI004064BB12
MAHRAGVDTETLGVRLHTDLVARVEAAGGVRAAARNPYWDEHGVTFQDPDGYLLVLSTRSWE